MDARQEVQGVGVDLGWPIDLPREQHHRAVRMGEQQTGPILPEPPKYSFNGTPVANANASKEAIFNAASQGTGSSRPQKSKFGERDLQDDSESPSNHTSEESVPSPKKRKISKGRAPDESEFTKNVSVKPKKRSTAMTANRRDAKTVTTSGVKRGASAVDPGSGEKVDDEITMETEVRVISPCSSSLLMYHIVKRGPTSQVKREVTKSSTDLCSSPSEVFKPIKDSKGYNIKASIVHEHKHLGHFKYREDIFSGRIRWLKYKSYTYQIGILDHNSTIGTSHDVSPRASGSESKSRVSLDIHSHRSHRR
jgi:hypothetical protein